MDANKPTAEAGEVSMKRWELLWILPIGMAIHCSGNTDETFDADGDGYAADTDCDDATALSYPGAAELCDGSDNDCDGDIDEGLTHLYYLDADGDAFGDPLSSDAFCEPPPHYVQNSLDCDDTNAAVYPDAPERCNLVDDDCDDSIDEGYDTDRDGFTSCAGDCDDDDADAHPNAEEICDGRDTDCDGVLGNGTIDESDGDNDGYLACRGDCDDDDPSIHPDAEEICDGLDNDCDDATDEDVQILHCPDRDEDGYGDALDISASCGDIPQGSTTLCDDCDDADPTVNPAAEEICDGIDDNCDGTLPSDEEDRDQDGLSPCEGDCNDDASDAHPGGTEICDDGIDQDCNGADRLCPDEDNDGDGFTDNEGDCNDADPEIHPGAAERCGDGIDQDCDGEPESTEGDEEPNDTLADAIDLGTLDSTTETCTLVEGLLESPDDHDLYMFYSIDQAGNDWAVSGTLVVPEGVRYCIDILDDTGAVLESTVCATGPTTLTNSVEFIPEIATGYYYIDVYADDVNSCALYSLTACGY